MTAQHSDCSTLTQGKDHLTALPNELLVNIVEQLPPREICLLRVQNRHMRTFVDENEGALTREALSVHHDRILQEYKLLTDFTGLDFIGVLMRYYRYYGAMRNEYASFDLPPLAEWGPNRYPMNFTSDAVRNTLFICWNKHLRADLSSSRLANSPIIDSSRAERFLETFSAIGEQHNALDQKKRVAVLLYLHDFLSGQPQASDAEVQILHQRLLPCFQSDGGDAVIPAHTGPPQCPLTRRSTGQWCYPGDESKGVRDTNITCILSACGLPELGPDASLAYCTDSYRTVKLIEKINQGTHFQLKQAAVLEGIYLW